MGYNGILLLNYWPSLFLFHIKHTISKAECMKGKKNCKLSLETRISMNDELIKPEDKYILRFILSCALQFIENEVCSPSDALCHRVHRRYKAEPGLVCNLCVL